MATDEQDPVVPETGAAAGPREWVESAEAGPSGPDTGSPDAGSPDIGGPDAGGPDAGQQEPAAEEEAVEQQVAELTADLQRLSAEYTNYRKRVERDREFVARDAKASVAGELLPVLDDFQRADAHGDLTGGVKAIVDKLESALRGAGLERFGAEGEAFDPSVHEAAQHGTSDSAEITEPTVTAVLRPGYRIEGQVLRTALVAVTEPETAPAGQPSSEGPGAVAE